MMKENAARGNRMIVWLSQTLCGEAFGKWPLRFEFTYVNSSLALRSLGFEGEFLAFLKECGERESNPRY
jgi:hypothetical protein